MHGSLPPIMIDGPDHPHAFDGIPLDQRPPGRDTRCTSCKGHGAWNAMLHIDTGRCRIQGCSECDGSGWISSNGQAPVADIVIVDGHPAWITRIEQRPVRSRTVAA